MKNPCYALGEKAVKCSAFYPKYTLRLQCVVDLRFFPLLKDLSLMLFALPKLKKDLAQIHFSCYRVTVFQCHKVFSGIVDLINERLTLRNGVEDLFYFIIRNY